MKLKLMHFFSSQVIQKSRTIPVNLRDLALFQRGAPTILESLKSNFLLSNSAPKISSLYLNYFKKYRSGT